jgi:hypothetical protein
VPIGWVAVVLEANRAFVTTDRSIKRLIESQPSCAVIAVDMPIGLPADGETRQCDQAARDYVGKRRNSVFPAPPRSVLRAATHKEATALATELNGKGISQQAYALRDKIEEVAPIADGDKRVIEVHPEVSFRALAWDTPLDFGKKSWNGQMHRLAYCAAYTSSWATLSTPEQARSQSTTCSTRRRRRGQLSATRWATASHFPKAPLQAIPVSSGDSATSGGSRPSRGCAATALRGAVPCDLSDVDQCPLAPTAPSRVRPLQQLG